MSKAPKSPDSPKKPSPKEVELNEDGNTISSVIENEAKLLEIAKTVKKNQEIIQLMRLELTEKDRIIKQISDKLEIIKVRRPPIRPPHFYNSKIEENPYLDDDLEYWQVSSTKPVPMPKSWISQLEKEEMPQIVEEPKVTKLPKIMTKQSKYRSTSSSKSNVYKKLNSRS